jgi:hypothetical protein
MSPIGYIRPMRRAVLFLALAPVLGTGCINAPVERPPGSPSVGIRMTEIPFSRLFSPLHIRVFDSHSGDAAGLACNPESGTMVPNTSPMGEPFATTGTNSVASVPGGAVDPLTRCNSGSPSSAAFDGCVPFSSDAPVDLPMPIIVPAGDYFVLVEGTGVLPNGSMGVLGSGCNWLRISAASPPDPNTPIVVNLREQH